MVYMIDDVDKILEFKTWNDKRKIDELLRIDCKMYTNLGSDSSKTERAEVKKNSRKIYRAISKIDERLGKGFLFAMDKE